jgi:hypothetical protein
MEGEERTIIITHREDIKAEHLALVRRAIQAVQQGIKLSFAELIQDLEVRIIRQRVEMPLSVYYYKIHREGDVLV